MLLIKPPLDNILMAFACFVNGCTDRHIQKTAMVLEPELLTDEDCGLKLVVITSL